MFTIITALAIMDRASPQKAEELVRWFDPAILWIQRWLGAFYVPSLAILPLTIQGIAGESLTAGNDMNGIVSADTVAFTQQGTLFTGHFAVIPYGQPRKICT